jgi:hypothetical protein
MPLPDKGRPWREVRADLIARGGKDANWRDGRTAMYVFNRKLTRYICQKTGSAPPLFQALLKWSAKSSPMD